MPIPSKSTRANAFEAMIKSGRRYEDMKIDFVVADARRREHAEQRLDRQSIARRGHVPPQEARVWRFDGIGDLVSFDIEEACRR